MRLFLLFILSLVLVGCEKVSGVFLEEDLLQRPPSQRCADCHAKIYEDWKESRHAKAWISEHFKQESENYSKLKCLSCHAPHQVDPEQKPLVRVERRHEGINCVACHFKEETKAMHGPYKVWSPPHPSKEDKNYTKSEICAGCHRETYKEWKIARVETTCQQCHMKVKDVTWIMDKFPFFLFHTRKALHDHSFSAGIAKKEDLKVFLTNGSLKIVNVGIPHNLPTADQGNPKLYVVAEVYYKNGSKETISRVLSPQTNSALRYLEPYYISIPNYEEVDKVVLRVFRRLAWKEERELILVDELRPVKIETEVESEDS